MLPSELILECMERRNISIKIVSDLTGICTILLQDYLDGIIPSNRNMQKICEGLNIDENDITYTELNISVNECAKIMGLGVLFVRNAVEKKKMPGICIDSKGRKCFHIPRKAFMQYMEQWNTDSALKEEVKSLKIELSGLKDVINDLSNALKNAPILKEKAH